MAIHRFEDRYAAGRELARELRKYANRPDVRVLALPRGGVPVGYEVAKELGVLLDVFLVRKLGVPGHEELAMGAIASGGVGVINREVVDQLGVSREDIQRVAREEQRELERREQAYRGEQEPSLLRGQTLLLVDDGLATGSTMRAAVRALKQSGPARIVVAVPVASAEACQAFEHEADEVVCLETPKPFRAVGLWYRDFSQTSDEEVRELLWRARELAQSSGPRDDATPTTSRHLELATPP
ncbi:phosphoribosyltransferase [Archangium violaceum]|uniref:phosphoribosyltransferase n=1 Tax=Archangium violaceum TaxID=83451 RepID=UPI001EF63AC9|nr:phosphoribosyltransferase [Archangium violaceum]